MIDIGQKLWGLCHTLRHDGMGYTEYIEQITYLIFIKMAEEKNVTIPNGYSWEALCNLSGDPMLKHYRKMLEELGGLEGIIGDIFAHAQNRFNKPANLKRVINEINSIDWSSLEVELLGKIYEDLLERAASEGKKGAGQYFTPRPLIRSMVSCIKPDPGNKKEFKICDPACGTGGFLVAAYEWLIANKKAMSRELAKRIKDKTFFGQEISQQPRRMALMNMFLHQVEPQIKFGDTIYEAFDGKQFDVILTNPPFGTRGANQAPDRDDFNVSTSNKQLNFVQHVMTALKPGGRAAIVLPDNCLFADQAGDVFKILTEDCDLHTIIRLPRGTFTPYCQGVKANVVFFTKGFPTENTWIYDCRTNIEGITKKDRPLTEEIFAEFEKCYGKDPNGRAKRKESDSKEGRWKSFHISEVKEKDYKFDGFKWIADESVDSAEELPEPEELATDAMADLMAATEELDLILKELDSAQEVDA